MKFTKNTRAAFFTAAMFLIALFSLQVSAQEKNGGLKSASTTSANSKIIEDKLVQFLKKSGGYTKLADYVWAKPSQAQSIGKFNFVVFVAPDTDEVTVFVIIAEKKNIKLSQDLLFKLLNFSASRENVQITDSGDLTLGIGMNGRLMDWQEFNDVTERVAFAADKLHERISKDLISSPK